MVKLDILAPVLQVLNTSVKKDCLLTSSVLEVVEYIRKEGLLTLGEYIATNHADCFTHALHAPVFEALQRSIAELKAQGKGTGGGMWRSNNLSLNSKSTSSGPRTGISAVAELRMLAAQEDEDSYSMEGVELEEEGASAEIKERIMEEDM